ncbi:hypothetical protein DID88_003957 [Monilinia fructigena]|uniref:Uncharacterized protein n=1 Tax=Monilinia fructigena TaxID=38457 RepID=A0A395IDY8_9HELO|nr:hypothetical protein DID88_003957 [Monilinia fructigena]
MGWTCNLIGIAYVMVTTVLFLFPPELPVTGSNMNYCVSSLLPRLRHCRSSMEPKTDHRADQSAVNPDK